MTTKKKLLLASSIVTAIAAASTAIFGVKLSNRLMYIKKKDDGFILERETLAERFDEAWYNKHLAQELTVQSPNGYSISGVLLKPLDTKNTMIICHGVTENKINSVRFARMFEKLGYNAVIYDHRRHGLSGGKTTSYGYYEKLDLDVVVKTVRQMVGEDAIIGVHGESMGAATTLLYAGLMEDEADFYISDCGFSNFESLIGHIAREEMHFTSGVPVRIADAFLRLRDGYSLRDVSPIEAVKHIQKPVLFIHSEPDTFIPATMTKEMYAVKEGPKMLKLFDTGRHAESFNENPREYMAVVTKFLDEYVPAFKLKATN
ncbi:alpha/beta hydrolase [Lysinibacillus alkalisoli]|uniref:Alpha/beta hydrolase n=1 Tax=Lysinibacillus alkalisoli TaxID=1911548 RepID=A0A917G0X0_9BACI|nr:alpha/beta hydrolase [Lysinibacillus alkalisoli]GGG17019.1 alpha/beta hydrolase [Lysinibacillus alkalisoli]